MKTRSPLAVVAAVAAAGLASAQPVQVQVQFKQAVRAYPADQPTTKPTADFKPPANADPDPATLTVPADLQKVAKELVGKLGSTNYSEREGATRKLAAMGRMCLPALQEAIASATEPEVALRAEGLLPKAEADDMKARVGSFLADAEGKYEHTLPGWEKFKAVAGSDRPSRKLFAEMLKSPLTHQMLLAAEKTAEEANGVLNQYITRLYNQQNGFRGGWNGGEGGGVAQQAKLPDLVAAIFLEGQFTDREVVVQATIPWGWGGNGNMSVTNYIGNVSEVQNAVYSNTGDYAAPIRKIMVQWMDSRETAQHAYQAYNFANSIFNGDRKKTIKYACRVLDAEGGPNMSYNKSSILQTLANQNLPAAELKAVVPSAAKCFEDTLLLWSWQNGGQPGFDIQLRDYALAFALQATDQKPEDYGMTRTQGFTGKQMGNQQAFHFTDDTPPKVPGGGPGGGFRGGKGGRVIIDDDVKKPEEPKKDDKKPEEPKKDDKKPEEPKKKVSQEDRRKIAFKKWEEWVKDGGLTKEPAKEPKKDDKKPDGPKPEEPKKPEAATTTPAVAPPVNKK